MTLAFARPVHPGEYLREEFLVPLKLSAGGLARRLGVPRARIERLAAERAPLSPDTALRLARFFRTTPQFWMNFQQAYDIETAGRRLAPELEAIEPLSERERAEAA